MRYLCCIVLIFSMQEMAYSQERKATGKPLQHGFGAQLVVPLAVFWKTHNPGAGLAYSVSPHLSAQSHNRLKNLGWIASGNLQIYPGKSETENGYSFKYNTYYRFDLAGGVNGRPFSNLLYSVQTGGSISLYSGNTRVGWNFQVQTQFLFSEKISLGPGLLISAMPETAALSSICLRGIYTF